jgi:Ca-activated chloride channel family protein
VLSFRIPYQSFSGAASCCRAWRRIATEFANEDKVHRVAIAIILTGAALVSVNAQSPTDRAQDTFRSSVDLVTIQASVRDSRGRVLQGLSQADFEVRDNGQLRRIVELRSDRHSPVSLAILVDMSGSMRQGPKIAMARQALESLLSPLRDGEDEVALFTFDASLHERRAFTTNLSSLKDALSEFEPFGTTSLYDATAATARRLAERSITHRAIVVLTDGVDTSSKLTAPQVSGLASAIDVPVYVVATVPLVDQHAMLEGTDRPRVSDAADLRDLAEWTGGHLVLASTFVDAIVAASRIVDELRQQYVIAIEASDLREWRRLQVRVKNPSATVKTRSGYFGG